jgi:hypothetical protein
MLLDVGMAGADRSSKERPIREQDTIVGSETRKMRGWACGGAHSIRPVIFMHGGLALASRRTTEAGTEGTCIYAAVPVDALLASIHYWVVVSQANLSCVLC